MITHMSLKRLIQDLLDSADNTGCSEDLTVVNAASLKDLQEMMEFNLYTILHHHRHGVSVYTVWSKGEPDEQDAIDLINRTEEYDPALEEWVEILPAEI